MKIFWSALVSFFSAITILLCLWASISCFVILYLWSQASAHDLLSIALMNIGIFISFIFSVVMVPLTFILAKCFELYRNLHIKQITIEDLKLLSTTQRTDAAHDPSVIDMSFTAKR